jgi:hypothetical protein
MEYTQEYFERPGAGALTMPWVAMADPQDPGAQIYRQNIERIAQEAQTPFQALRELGIGSPFGLTKPFLPGGFGREAYEQWQAPSYLRGGIETALGVLPFMGLPSATQAIKGIKGAGLAPRVARGALQPVAAVERGMAKPFEKLAGGLARRRAKLELTKELRNVLPSSTDLGLKPRDQSKMIKGIADELTGWVRQVSRQRTLTPREYAQQALKSTPALRERLKGRISDFVAKSSQPERLLEKADGFIEGGKLWRTLYEPLDKGIMQALKSHIQVMRALDALGNRVGAVKGGKGVQALYDLANQQIGVTLGGKQLSKMDRIVIYTYLNQKSAASHLPATYGLRPKQMDSFKQLQRVANSITSDEKFIADRLRAIVGIYQKPVASSYQYAWNKPMAIEPNYFPIKVVRGPLADIGWGLPSNMSERRLAQILFGGQYPSAGIPRGMTRARSGRAIEPLETNLVDVALGHSRNSSYFANVFPVTKDLQKLIGGKSPQAQKLAIAIKQTQGDATYDVLKKYLIDASNPNFMRGAKDLESVFRHLRTNTTTAFLGFNLVSSMKQFPSWLLGVARGGHKPAMKGLHQLLTNSRRVDLLLRKHNPELFLRGKALGAGIERELIEIAQKRTMAKGIGKAYWGLKNTSMALIRTVDRMVVRSLWIGAYDDALAKGLKPAQAASQANQLIRQTQPYFSPKDLAHYWRGGELNKMLTIFTNQLNRNWNFILYDVFGKAGAGAISKPEAMRRFMEGIVGGALLIGAINRSRPAQDLGEIRDDLTYSFLAQIPLWGSWLSGSIGGFTDTNVVPLELLSQVQRATYNLNKGAWDKLLAQSPDLAALSAGLPLNQPERTIKAIIDLASDKSDDWLELIWGAWVREQAREPEPQPSFRPVPGQYRGPTYKGSTYP